jgi:hypothetical protein
VLLTGNASWPNSPFYEIEVLAEAFAAASTDALSSWLSTGSVMTRRSAASAAVHMHYSDTTIISESNGQTVLIAASNGWQVGAVKLEKYEGLMVETSAPLVVRAPAGKADGPLIVIAIRQY